MNHVLCTQHIKFNNIIVLNNSILNEVTQRIMVIEEKKKMYLIVDFFVY